MNHYPVGPWLYFFTFLPRRLITGDWAWPFTWVERRQTHAVKIKTRGVDHSLRYEYRHAQR